jgi:hypothetical protein
MKTCMCPFFPPNLIGIQSVNCFGTIFAHTHQRGNITYYYITKNRNTVIQQYCGFLLITIFLTY